MISQEELDRRVSEVERQELNVEKRKLFDRVATSHEATRLLNSSEYTYVEKFVAKFGGGSDVDDYLKFQELLAHRGFKFTEEQLTDVLAFTHHHF